MGKLIVEGVDLSEFIGVPYTAGRHPGNTSVDEFLTNLQLGANCQLFALGVLRKAGFYIDDRMPMDQGERFGSKEFWEDNRFTAAIVSDDQPLQKNIDILLDTQSYLRAFDVYFYLPPGAWFRGMRDNVSPEALKKLHVAVWLGRVEGWGEGNPYRILHNAKPGPSALWSSQDFAEKGYALFGVKRPIRTAT